MSIYLYVELMHNDYYQNLMTSSVGMNSLSREANSEVDQVLAISCEAETSVGIELELAFGSICG